MMCGKALPFRWAFSNSLAARLSLAARVKSGRHGKPEAFRTSGGTAAAASLSAFEDKLSLSYSGQAPFQTSGSPGVKGFLDNFLHTSWGYATEVRGISDNATFVWIINLLRFARRCYNEP